MTTLTWQTLLLLAVTYFAGCCIGCLAHRAVWRRRAQPAVVETAEPLSASGVAAQAVLDRSTAPAPVVANRTATASSAQPAREPFRRADAPAPQPNPVTGALGSAAGSAHQAARIERVLESGGQIPAQLEPVASAAGDDLKRIRAIDTALEAQLKALGAGTFAAIAQWTAADTARMSRELGFKGRIEQENWIEQAQILAKGGDTRYSQRLARGEVAAARAIEDEGERRPPVAALASAVSARAVADRTAEGIASSPNVSDRAAFARNEPQAAETAEPATSARPATVGTPDDLQRIRGINMEVEALLNRQGVTRYSQISSWSRVDTGRFDGLLGQDGRIARENWIEQAQILARGGDTSYSRDYDRRVSGAKTAEEQASAGRTSDLAALRSVRSEAYRAGEDAAIGRSGFPVEPDDLKRIRGIGILVERKLNSLGVMTYAQIAGWSAADVDKASEVLELKDRAALESWIEQARLLLMEDGGPRTRRISVAGLQREHIEEPIATVSVPSTSLAGDGAIGSAVRTSELAPLRSVRSEAYRPGQDVSGARGGRPAEPDDLKRIRGIGVLIEKKLNGLGVSSYEHIANWTAADIARVSQVLDFKGRIERENWVEQARILASGGQTEFSRRIDRGTAVPGSGP
jgi:predicted flap endonuclease-1-like 5' DNA nuclease